MMDTLTYAVETNTHRIVEATWTGTRFQLVVYGVNWSDCQVEWHKSLDKAVQRFNWLIERNSKYPRTQGARVPISTRGAG